MRNDRKKNGKNVGFERNVKTPELRAVPRAHKTEYAARIEEAGEAVRLRLERRGHHDVVDERQIRNELQRIDKIGVGDPLFARVVGKEIRVVGIDRRLDLVV